MNLPPATPEESAEFQELAQAQAQVQAQELAQAQAQSQAQAQAQAQEQAQAQAQAQSQLRRRMLIGMTAYIGLMVFNQEAMRETANDVNMMFGDDVNMSVLQYAVSSVAMTAMFLYAILS